MIDDSQIQLGDVYVLSFKISCGKDVLFNSNEYSVLLKEVINQPSEDEKRIGTLEYYQETLPEISYYYTMIEGFSSIRCFYGRSSIGEYVVKIYDPESMQEMTEFTGYFSVDNDVSGDHIEIDTNENLTQDSIQFKIGIYRDSVGFDEYYTILDPQESEIYTLNKYSE
ncbi:MAG: hypothetical protein MJ233_05285 [Mycoplasmoidaceae bacterium]|nr:hypothetical protein [Mycoplasmoidaceae bacterium]